MIYQKAPGSSTFAPGSLSAQRSDSAASRRWKAVPQGVRVAANLTVNAAWVLLSIAFVFGLSAAISAAVSFRQGNEGAMAYLQWFTAFVTISSVAIFALQDLLKALDKALWVPFQYSLSKASGIYWQRFQVFLLAIAFDVLLITLCAAFPTMSFVSQLFLASIFALTLFAVRKSIPVARLGLLAAIGVFIAAMSTIFITLFFVGVPEEEINANEGEATEMLDEAERRALEEEQAGGEE